MKFTEAVYLAGIPAVGTAVAYLFEAGFASFHGIPIYMVQLGIAQLVGTAVVGLLCLWVLHIYFALVVEFLARQKQPIIKFVGLGLLFAIFPALLLVGHVAEGKLWGLVGASFALPFAQGLVFAISSRDRSKPFFQRMWDEATNNWDRFSRSPDGFTPLVEKPQAVLAVSILFVLLVFSFGHHYASIYTPTLVLKADPTKALVVVYGDRWFFRSVTEVGGPQISVAGELYILSSDSAKELALSSHEKARASAVTRP